jgi:tRNA (cytidine/uridine-2'-O-)-methyltransferase
LAPLPPERKYANQRGCTAAAAALQGPSRTDAHRPLSTGYPAEYRDDSAPVRLPGIEAHLIGPAGFPASDRAFRRAGMDYLDAVVIVRHRSWRDFESWRRGTEGHRLVLFTTTGALSYLDYRYRVDDILLFGHESAGVAPEVHAAADARLVIPMRPGLRSLNVAAAAAMSAGEALRQTGGFRPGPDPRA